MMPEEYLLKKFYLTKRQKVESPNIKLDVKGKKKRKKEKSSVIPVIQLLY